MFLRTRLIRGTPAELIQVMFCPISIQSIWIENCWKIARNNCQGKRIILVGGQWYKDIYVCRWSCHTVNGYAKTETISLLNEDCLLGIFLVQMNFKKLSSFGSIIYNLQLNRMTISITYILMVFICSNPVILPMQSQFERLPHWPRGQQVWLLALKLQVQFLAIAEF